MQTTRTSSEHVRGFTWCLAAWLASGLAVAADQAPPEVTTPDASGEEPPSLWFPVGETIEYKVQWGVLSVARSTVTTEWVEEDGRTLIAIQLRTKSNHLISTVYPVDDFLESVIDPETFLPVRFTKKLSEGRYRTNEVTTFDHANGTATFEDRLDNITKEYEIDPDTRDLISFMYAMRTTDWPIGEKQSFRVMADEKLYDLHVKAVKLDRVKLPNHGKVESMLLDPQASFEGLFVRKGKMRLWVSQGERRRLMTKAAVKIPLADVKLILDTVSGPGEDAWVNPPEKPEKSKRRRTSRGRGR